MREHRFLLLSGGIIEVKYPDEKSEDEEIAEEIWNEIFHHWSNQQLWNCGNWPNLEATFGDEILDYIDFQKIIGIVR